MLSYSINNLMIKLIFDIENCRPNFLRAQQSSLKKYLTHIIFLAKICIMLAVQPTMCSKSEVILMYLFLYNRNPHLNPVLFHYDSSVSKPCSYKYCSWPTPSSNNLLDVHLCLQYHHYSILLQESCSKVPLLVSSHQK